MDAPRSRLAYVGLALVAAIALPVQFLQTSQCLRLLAAPAQAGGTRERLLVVTLGIATPLVCLLLGFAVAAIRPRDHRAWIVLGLLLSFGQMAARQVGPVDLIGPPAMRVMTSAYVALLRGSWALFMLLFGVYFPHRPAQRWLGRAMLLAFGLPLAILASAAALSELIGSRIPAVGTALARGLELGTTPLQFALVMCAIGGFFFQLAHKAGTERDADARRRLWLLYAGSSASLTPLFLLLLASFARREPIQSFSGFLLVPALLALFLFPATLAYVIVVRRALDVRVVIRQGLQYAFATRAIVALQIALSFVVVFAAASLAADSQLNRPGRIRVIGFGGMAVVLLRVAALRVKGWIDRRFFRAAVDAEEVLAKIGDEVRAIVETGPLLARVADSIAEALHVIRVAILLREGDRYAVRHARGDGIDAGFVLAASGPTIARLRANDDPLVTRLDDAKSWVHRDLASSPERALLTGFGVEVLLPLVMKDELLGVIALGQRRSEAPFSRSELRLLDSVASQTALALEHGRLTHAVASELAQRARMNREIEIAAEVQERLLPQVLPTVRRLEVAGHCRPARGIGGDYYDFLMLPDGQLGIAIGDISGKGIPAALLMATLQASLRARLVDGPRDLAQMMVSLNRLIFASSAHNRYATFFFAVFDPESRRLRYVNAGHNAPAVLREGVAPIRLSGGGPVIGLLADAAYREEGVVLVSGDLLVAFTDGISEAMNAADEEWTEESLLAAAEVARSRPLADLITTLVVGADAHAGGTPQFDDMTLVVARVG